MDVGARDIVIVFFEHIGSLSDPRGRCYFDSYDMGNHRPALCPEGSHVVRKIVAGEICPPGPTLWKRLLEQQALWNLDPDLAVVLYGTRMDR